MSDGQSQCDSLAQSPHAPSSSADAGTPDVVSVSVVPPNEAQERAEGGPKCSLADVDFLFPSTWGNSAAYQRLRHLRSIEASALHYQLQRQSSTPTRDHDVPALRRIDALMEIQRRECFRLDGKLQANSPLYVYAARNEDGELIRKEYIRDRMWPPKEFALKNTPKTGPGRGGGRKRKVPEKTPAQLDEERLAMDFGKTCIDCGALSSPLWRQVDAVVDIPDSIAPDQEVVIPKEDICLACYVQRTCGAKVRAAQAGKKKKDKAKSSSKDDSSKSKKAAPVPASTPAAAATPAPLHVTASDDVPGVDHVSTDDDDKRRKKSSKKSSKKKKKKSKRSSSSAPGSPVTCSSPKKSHHPHLPPPHLSLAPLVVDDDDDSGGDFAAAMPPPPPQTSRSNRKDSKKRSRDASPRVTPKASKKDTSIVRPVETPREKELRAKGQYCPVCNRTYEDDDASEFVCCDGCEMWVHSLCDPLMNAERLRALADSDAKYIGPCCANPSSKRQR
ncbi:hypothetical protein DYB26_011244 [Aphanomyces astaci]|uniref:GATA-type domain-containing protein n=1 Tax=Aphanomyces astaci TaxID=112090 RepID=A0A418E4L2_APHAT|nr:hypothetical protein DYB26_011244 [Aphanomyces astaci]